VARSLQERESVELIDAKSRREHSVAQRKNLRIARFLNRIVFCFFAEDTGLLPKDVVTGIFKTGADDPAHFAQTLEELFRTMAEGGRFGAHKIRYFNGHLFEEATVFELTEDELGKLAVAGEADWQFIQPSIMGNLFERGLDPDQRAQLGAHYTNEEDIRTLVEPVLMAPLRREWSKIKGALARAFITGKGGTKERATLTKFHDQLVTITVLDPACGSGNFLYVSLQLLLDLEKELIAFATQLGFKFEPRVSVQQLKAIELNAYAFELAQVAVQIGYLKWRRDNGFGNDKDPVLQNLANFQNEDALLVPHFHSKAKSLKEAQAGEHATDDALKFYTEREWPDAQVILGNPPFLGDKKMRGELGDVYVEELRRVFEDRLGGQTDLCCYWFEKAHEQIAGTKCKRAGLLATQGIRFASNRKVLQRICDDGGIFFAISDRPWILNGANVQISMVGFDDGRESIRELDNRRVSVIYPDLKGGSSSSSRDLTTAKPLIRNQGICYLGVMKAGAFTLNEKAALKMLLSPNPHGRPNSDVLRPRLTARDLLNRTGGDWIIDFGTDAKETAAALYQLPFQYLETHVKPERLKNRRKRMAQKWWLHGEARPGLRKVTAELPRFILTPEISKYRAFVWVQSANLADHKTRAFGRANDGFFGILHSSIHELWARAQGTQLRERESGFTYTPTTCFETFPFPKPTPTQEQAIAAAAKELNELRENWLNPPEWTTTRVLEFPGSIDGPWSRFVHEPDAHGIGTVRYPRLEPRDDDEAKKLAKRTLTNLYNERPAWLAHAHAKLDAAVAEAYGFPVDLTDEQILERLLALNLERAAGEATTVGRSSKKRQSRAKTDEELI
jgi:hypothetical protein